MMETEGIRARVDDWSRQNKRVSSIIELGHCVPWIDLVSSEIEFVVQNRIWLGLDSRVDISFNLLPLILDNNS